MLSLVLAWETFKDWLSKTVGLTHWDLHIIIGLALLFGLGRIMRRPLRSFLPLLPIALLELGNEMLDFLRTVYGAWYWNWPDTIVEIGLTLGPPLLVILCARLVSMRSDRQLSR